MTGRPSPLIIPPPAARAVLSMNEQPSMSGLLPERFRIAAPTSPRLPVKMQSRTVGLLPTLCMPPPREASPPVIVKPSSSVSGPSPLAQVTTVPAPWASIVVSSGPAVLRRVTALPPKSIISG
jgi:hypothetical protein